MEAQQTDLKHIIVFSTSPILIEKVRTLFPESTVEVFDNLRESFDAIKSKEFNSLVFETYQVHDDHYIGLNDTDLDILLFYATGDDSQNRHMSFLPIDPEEKEEGHRSQEYYADLYNKYFTLLKSSTISRLERSDFFLDPSRELLSGLLLTFDSACENLDKKMGAYEEGNPHLFQEESNDVADDLVNQDLMAEMMMSELDDADDVTIISGDGEDIGEETIMIKGSGSEQEDDIMRVKSLSSEEKIEEEIQVKGIDYRDKDGLTPIMVFAKAGNHEMVRNLMAKGANARLNCRQGKSLLHYLAMHPDNIDLMEELVTLKGMKFNRKDSNGLDVLAEAIKADNAQAVKLLIRQGARTISKIKGQPLLHFSLDHNALGTFLVLLSAGLSLEATNDNGNDIFQYCKTKKKMEFTKALKAFQIMNKKKDIA